MANVTPGGRYLGGRKDRPDTNDFTVNILSHLGIAAPLPPRADVLHGLTLPVYNQGQLGSCTANTGALFRRWLAQRFPKLSAADRDLSRLFLYYEERALPWNHSTGEDSGAEIRDIFKVLAKTGICPESDDPYNVKRFAVAPTEKDLVDAQAYRIGAYHRLVNLHTAKSCLASGYPLALGFPVYDSFDSIGADGVMPMPQAGEQLQGGHAVFCHGYDDDRGALVIQNSWGAGWGAGGHFYMPYAFVEKYADAIDMWTAHLGPKAG